jgi:hypothetical protein
VDFLAALVYVVAVFNELGFLGRRRGSVIGIDSRPKRDQKEGESRFLHVSLVASALIAGGCPAA